MTPRTRDYARQHALTATAPGPEVIARLRELLGVASGAVRARK